METGEGGNAARSLVEAFAGIAGVADAGTADAGAADADVVDSSVGGAVTPLRVQTLTARPLSRIASWSSPSR